MLAFNADSILRDSASTYIATQSANWACAHDEEDAILADFEAGLDYDMVVDFVAVQAYYKAGVPVAWLDYECGTGYRAG